MGNLKKIVVLIIIYLILVFISLKWNVGYLPIGIIILSSLLLLSLIIWLILNILKLKNARLFLILSIICLLGFISVFFISRISNRITTKRANLIIEKITEYKNSKGHYPESLNDMIPMYLSNIPKPTFNNSDIFFYELVDCIADSTNVVFCNNFILKYYGTLEMEAKYSSKKKKWEYND